jgi:acetyl-CoA carboxylase biotin carboxyl carrier protein
MPDEKQTERAATGAAQTKVDIEGVRQLLALMKEHELAELEIEQGDMAVRLRKGGAVGPVMMAAAPAAAVPATAPAAPAAHAVKEDKLPTINSPIVGTFYAASSPDAASYVKVGDHVSEDTVVCIIEAMKVFNEIRAETSGTIEKILVKNAQTVEFGQALFVVRPD